ncbi:unnamed protein product [Brassica oleracea var. botrytis]
MSDYDDVNYRKRSEWPSFLRRLSNAMTPDHRTPGSSKRWFP